MKWQSLLELKTMKCPCICMYTVVHLITCIHHKPAIWDMHTMLGRIRDKCSYYLILQVFICDKNQGVHV